MMMQLKFKKEHAIRALRLSIALIIGFIISWLAKLPYSVWTLVTIVVVLFDQSTVGGTLQRGFLRIIATVISALIGFLILFVFHDNNYVNTIAILLVTFIYAYLFIDTKQSYIGILGSVTLIMILAFGASGNNLQAPIFRGATIVIGVVIAILTMLLFYPQYAKNNIITFMGEMINQLEEMVKLFTDKDMPLEVVHENFNRIENKYITDIIKLNRLIDEIRFETKSLTINKQYQLIVLQLRRIHRLLAILIYHIPNAEIRFNSGLTQRLEQLSTLFNQTYSQFIRHDFNFKTPEFENFVFDISTTNATSNNHETIFIHTLINHLMNESTILVMQLTGLNRNKV